MRHRLGGACYTPQKQLRSTMLVYCIVISVLAQTKITNEVRSPRCDCQKEAVCACMIAIIRMKLEVHVE